MKQFVRHGTGCVAEQKNRETKMAIRHFLKLADFTKDELNTMLRRAAEIKALQKAGTPYAPFGGKVLVMIFEKASTRTRVSFESGARRKPHV